MEHCCLCGKGGDASRSLVSVTNKGKKTLVSVSENLRDGKAESIEALLEPKVHADCRKDYTRPSSIQRQKRLNQEMHEDESCKRIKLRSSEDSFDFKVHCFFCGKDASVDTKIPADRRKDIHKVETLEFVESIKAHCRERNDTWGERILSRIEHVYDLVATEARYHDGCRAKFFLCKAGTSGRGRPADDKTLSAFNNLCDYLEENEDCQYSLEELLNHMQDSMTEQCTYTTKYLRQKLKSKFGDRIIVTTLKNRTNVVIFKDSSEKILQESWYSSRQSDPTTERMRIVEKAASIIRDDIRSKVYECDEYPLSSSVIDSSELIPPTLLSFLQQVIGPCGSKIKSVTKRRASAIAQSIIAACRPRSFISPVLLSIALYIHRKYASKELIDILNSLMFCSSYREVHQYVNSIMESDDHGYTLDGFVQFVFDNADSNIRTLDGYNTFHAMGGIASVSPGSTLTEKVLNRVKGTVQESKGSFGFIPIVQYSPSSSKKGLESVEIREMSKLCKTLPDIKSSALDSIWMAGKILNILLPSWAGFMQIGYKNKQSYQSRIEILPFINMNPSDMSTIYTALKFAQRECERHDLRMCPVNFDQPLYIKAVDIILSSNDLSMLFIRLGGFHLLMSFMGFVGFLMAGSGLDELWGSIYAPGTVDHMLTGHAYSRALRAHLLTQTAIAKLMFDGQDFDETISSDILLVYQRKDTS